MNKSCLKEQSFTSAEVTKQYLEIEVIVPENNRKSAKQFPDRVGFEWRMV